MKPQSYKGSVCWITGASSGIGRALAILLAKEGADLILTARSKVKIDETISLCALENNRASSLLCDLEKTELMSSIANSAIEIYGGVDYLFHCAGFSQRSTVLETSLNSYSRLMNVHYFSAVGISKVLLPHFVDKGFGHFIITSSLSGKYGVPLRSGYSAAKHALHGFFDSLRAENDQNGISVTIACPGYIKTDISINALDAEGKAQGTMDKNQKNGISAEKCASQMIDSVLKGKKEVYIGGKEILSIYIKRFFPTLLGRLVKKAVANQ